MTDFLDSLIDEAVLHGELSAGAHPKWLAAQHDARLVGVLAQGMEVEGGRNGRTHTWSAAEDQFLRDNIGYLSDAEMGQALGRSANAIKVRRVRAIEPEYRSASVRHEWLCLYPAALMLGFRCGKGLNKLVERGLIPARDLPLESRRRVVSWFHLVRFAVNPENWLYFYPERVTHPRLKRMIRLRQARWQDEWWTIGQVAAYHGVTVKAISNRIRRGQLSAKRWGNWWIKRSVAMEMRIASGKGNGAKFNWSDAADDFVALARGVGYSYVAIDELCHWARGRTAFRVDWLRRSGELAHIARRAGVNYREETGELWADWRDHAHRFPRLAGAMRRFLAGESLPDDTYLVRGAVAAWLCHQARSEAEHRAAVSLRQFTAPGASVRVLEAAKPRYVQAMGEQGR